MLSRLLAVALAAFFCSCSPGSSSFELVDEKVRKSAEASAREFIEQKSPEGRSLPAEFAAARARWSERLQLLKPGMPEGEAKDFMSRLGANHGAGWPFVTIYELDEDWSVALGWNPRAEGEEETLMGWRLYGFPEWVAALPEVDVELVCAIRHIPRPGDENRDPVQLLRVVNQFVAAGREKSLVAIAAFHRVDGPMCREWRWEISATGDERAGVLIACLFLSRDGTPFPAETGLKPWFGDALPRVFPNLPVLVEGDLPFVLNPYLGDISFTPVRDQLKWAEDHGSFRQAPLSPRKTPAQVADDVLKQFPDGKTRKVFEGQIWSQALAACGDCFPGSARPSQIGRLEPDLREVILEQMRAVRMSWDAVDGRYVSPK